MARAFTPKIITANALLTKDYRQPYGPPDVV